MKTKMRNVFCFAVIALCSILALGDVVKKPTDVNESFRSQFANEEEAKESPLYIGTLATEAWVSNQLANATVDASEIDGLISNKYIACEIGKHFTTNVTIGTIRKIEYLSKTNIADDPREYIRINGKHLINYLPIFGSAKIGLEEDGVDVIYSFVPEMLADGGLKINCKSSNGIDTDFLFSASEAEPNYATNLRDALTAVRMNNAAFDGRVLVYGEIWTKFFDVKDENLKSLKSHLDERLTFAEAERTFLKKDEEVKGAFIDAETEYVVLRDFSGYYFRKIGISYNTATGVSTVLLTTDDLTVLYPTYPTWTHNGVTYNTEYTLNKRTSTTPLSASFKITIASGYDDDYSSETSVNFDEDSDVVKKYETGLAKNIEDTPIESLAIVDNENTLRFDATSIKLQDATTLRTYKYPTQSGTLVTFADGDGKLPDGVEEYLQGVFVEQDSASINGGLTVNAAMDNKFNNVTFAHDKFTVNHGDGTSETINYPDANGTLATREWVGNQGFITGDSDTLESFVTQKVDDATTNIVRDVSLISNRVERIENRPYLDIGEDGGIYIVIP